MDEECQGFELGRGMKRPEHGRKMAMVRARRRDCTGSSTNEEGKGSIMDEVWQWLEYGRGMTQVRGRSRDGEGSSINE